MYFFSLGKPHLSSNSKSGKSTSELGRIKILRCETVDSCASLNPCRSATPGSMFVFHQLGISFPARVYGEKTLHYQDAVFFKKNMKEG